MLPGPKWYVRCFINRNPLNSRFDLIIVYASALVTVYLYVLRCLLLGALEVVTDPVSQNAEVYSPISLSCEFQNAASITWYHDRLPIIRAEDQSTLRISMVNPTDQGYYYCRAEGVDGETVNTKVASIRAEGIGCGIIIHENSEVIKLLVAAIFLIKKFWESKSKLYSTALTTPDTSPPLNPNLNPKPRTCPSPSTPQK